MIRIEVLSPGALTTVRDLGRTGLAHLGISPGGAADTVALRLANRLVGNPEDAPGLEMTLQGGRFRFESEATIALTGGEFDANIPLYTTTVVPARFELRVAGSRAGVRCYLAVNGRLSGTVKRGAILTVENSRPAPLLRCEAYPYRHTLRVTAGPDTDAFPAEALNQLLGVEWTVSDFSNRQGVRLTNGPAISGGVGLQPSEGVALGAIQVPPDGMPVILFVDSQTTGGYPVLANVASVDLPSVAQLRPRDRVRFELISFREARHLLLEQEATIFGD